MTRGQSASPSAAHDCVLDVHKCRHPDGRTPRSSNVIIKTPTAPIDPVSGAAGGRALRRRTSLIKVSAGDAAGRNVPTVFALCPLRATVAPLELCISGPARPSVTLWSRSCPQAAPRRLLPLRSRPLRLSSLRFVFGLLFSPTVAGRHSARAPSDAPLAARSRRAALNFPLFLFPASPCTSTGRRSHSAAKTPPPFLIILTVC